MNYLNKEYDTLTCSKITEQIEFLWSEAKVANYLGLSALEITRERRFFFFEDRWFECSFLFFSIVKRNGDGKSLRVKQKA